MIKDAERILADATAAHLEDRQLAGSVVLFSGGNDSSVLLDLMVRLGAATHAAHANTTIGISETRRFVRDRCVQLGVPLLERTAPVSYRELVLTQGGFPGPAQHFRMYQRLKDRALRDVRRELVTNGYRQRVLFIAGRRRAESTRRNSVPEHERVDSVIWASPLANWTAADLDEYRERFQVPRNPVSEKLGMSGECLCGAFAEPGELHRLRHHYPEVAAEIESIQDELAERNLEAQRSGAKLVPAERCTWGWGAYRDGRGGDHRVGPLCSSCDARQDPAARLNLSAEESERVRDTHARILARRG